MSPAIAQAAPAPTINGHLIAVRAAANEVNNPAGLTVDELDRLIGLAKVEVKELRQGFACTRGDIRLEARYEAAGRAVKALLTSLEVKRQALAGGI